MRTRMQKLYKSVDDCLKSGTIDQNLSTNYLKSGTTDQIFSHNYLKSGTIDQKKLLI